MIAPIRTTLGRDLTFRSASEPYQHLVGKSAFALVPPSHHNFLDAARRELFERRRLVCCELPISSANRSRPRWWILRAAPICDDRRVLVAVAHALPRGCATRADWGPISVAAWERELAIRELLPILPGFDAEVLSAILGFGRRGNTVSARFFTPATSTYTHLGIHRHM